ncbi:MAG: Inositol-1-phosphate synthase, partial [uncultured Solirubrobacteraceae bacterium]
ERQRHQRQQRVRKRSEWQRRRPLRAREGPRGHHRRGQLRVLVRAGRPVLPRRRCRPAGARPDARRPRRLPRLRHRVLRRLRHRRREGGQGPLRGDLRGPEQHAEVRRGRPAPPRRPGPARHDARRPRQVPLPADHQGARPHRRHSADPQGHPHRRRGLLPAGRLRAGHEVVRRADPGGRLRLRQLHPGVHRPRAVLERPLREGRPADHRRRHQVAGRRDHRPPHARPPVRRSRRQDAAHVAAQRRRQHGLLQHARARAPRVQEDLQDQRGHVDHGPHAARRRRLHRAVGLRPVADRPQVGPHPRRGAGVRRRAAEPRAQAGGVGLPELGGHRHRRRPLLQARAQPRRGRAARRAELLPDEVADEPAPRSPRPRGDRAVHRRAFAQRRRRPAGARSSCRSRPEQVGRRRRL